MIYRMKYFLWFGKSQNCCGKVKPLYIVSIQGINLRVSEPDFKVVHTEIIAQVQLCRKMLSAERFFLSQVFFFLGGGERGDIPSLNFFVEMVTVKSFILLNGKEIKMKNIPWNLYKWHAWFSFRLLSIMWPKIINLVQLSPSSWVWCGGLGERVDLCSSPH